MRSRTSPLVVAIAMLIALAPRPAAAACDWPAAKKLILSVLDGEPERAAKFRKLADDGHDSLEVIEALVSAEDRPILRDCRWEAGDYLTQRGYPPLH